MPRREEPRRKSAVLGALSSSLVVHALGIGIGALIFSRSLERRASHVASAPASSPREVDVDMPTSFDVGHDATRATTPKNKKRPEPLVPGGGPLLREPDTERPGRGGSAEASELATNLASTIDPISLEREPLTHLDRSEAQRVKSGLERASWDDHRAALRPMELTFLATGRGQVRERRDPGLATQGSVAGATPAPRGATIGQDAAESAFGQRVVPGADSAGERQSRAALGAVTGAPGDALAHGASVLLARPWVQRARPAVPAEERARPSDTVDSSQAVSSRVEALIHASSAGGALGPGVGGVPVGGQPGRAGDDGIGSRSTRSGFGPGLDQASDPGLMSYSASVKRKVDDALREAFPKWAIAEGRGGHVIFDIQVRADGQITDVQMVRPSGIVEFDRNVMTRVSRLASLGPLPKVLGPRVLFSMSYDALNRVIGRDGPGPGGYGAAH
ncbi:MAG TPA: TonB family protein [Polyangiaceae bacterium]|jgi:TonB family protein